MRRRIFFFYTLTLILALGILLAVSGVVVHLVSQAYQRPQGPGAGRNYQQVQQVLSQWPEENRDWRALDGQLEELGCQLVVELDHRVLYSSLDEFQEQVYQRFSQNAVWPEDGTMALQDQGAVMVGRQCGSVSLIAMPRPEIPEMFGRQRPQTEAVILSLLISGAAAACVIVVFALLAARDQMKRVMRPVNALIQAARRVEAGDLSTPVTYQGADEFSAVCAAFDQMQQHLLREREKNARYEQARTDLVAGISHDLRTPLTSVKGYLKGMQDGVANTPEKQARYLEIAYRKAGEMERLLQRLFYFSKLETGSLPMLQAPADLGEFVGRFAREAGEELAQAGGRVDFSCAPGPHSVRIDPEQMLRVLSNLKENALRYSGADPLVLTLKVWRQRDKEYIRFADNGRGVSQEQLPHLFEQFWRGDQARSSQGGEGSGLGLYIVRYIVQAHGGSVEARSEQGLVVEIALPCEEVE